MANIIQTIGSKIVKTIEPIAKGTMDELVAPVASKIDDATLKIYANAQSAIGQASINIGSNLNTVSDRGPINLLHYLKKKLRSTAEVEATISRLSDSEKYVGFLPDNWRNKFSQAEIHDKTLKIQKIFSDFASQAYSETTKNIEELVPQVSRFEKALEEEFGSACSVKFIGSGDYGKVFKIESCGEELALKIYHSDPPTHLLWAHGKTKEIANAIYANRSMKPNQCSRFYFGKVVKGDESDGYMVTKLVHSKNESISEPFNRWEYGRLELGDKNKAGNIINNAITDYGGISYKFENRQQQLIAKELYPLIKKGDIQGIKKLKEKYACSPEFEDFTSDLTKSMRRFAVNPIAFANRAHFYTRNDIEAYRILGVDFKTIEQFDYSDAPVEIIDRLKALGLK